MSLGLSGGRFVRLWHVVRCRCHWENIILCVGKEMGLFIIIIIKALISPFLPESMIAPMSQISDRWRAWQFLGVETDQRLLELFDWSNQMSSVLEGLSLNRRWLLHWTMSCRQASKAAILTFQCCWTVSDRRGRSLGARANRPGRRVGGAPMIESNN